MERQVAPTVAEIRFDHVARYQFAVGWIRENLPDARRVLDAACGCGYGSHILAEAGYEVVGVDISSEAVAYAKAHYSGTGKTTFIQSDAEDLPDLGDFDVAVSFETVEHIENPSKLINYFNPRAPYIIVSSPNESFWHWQPSNKYHKRHYTIGQLEQLLAGYCVIGNFGQTNRRAGVNNDCRGQYIVLVAKREAKHAPLVINTMHGLGDSLYTRALIKEVSKYRRVFVRTPWPQIYKGIKNVYTLLEDSPLRTQSKNVLLSERNHITIPSDAVEIAPKYGAQDMHRSIPETLSSFFDVRTDTLSFDLPPLPPSPVSSEKPIAVVRPVTVREEWSNEARNPLPEYVARVAERLMETHHVVSVADLEEGEERALEPLPPAHETYHNGEIPVMSLLALVESADVVVGGVGWIVPACLATKTKAIIVLGGQGQHNAPDKITPKDADNFLWLTPDNYCLCAKRSHDCDKTISDFDSKLDFVNVFLRSVPK